MTDRNEAFSPHSTAEYRALDAAHPIHPFSDMGALNRAGSRVIVKADGVYSDAERKAIGELADAFDLSNAEFGDIEQQATRVRLE